MSTVLPQLVVAQMASAHAWEEFRKNDVELTVPPGQPRPILIIVMVSYAIRWKVKLIAVGTGFMVSVSSLVSSRPS